MGRAECLEAELSIFEHKWEEYSEELRALLRGMKMDEVMVAMNRWFDFIGSEVTSHIPAEEQEEYLLRLYTMLSDIERLDRSVKEILG